MTRDPSTRDRRRARIRVGLGAALVAVPLLAACGSTSSSSSSDPKFTVPATPSFTVNATDNKYDAKEYTATAGQVSVAMHNKGNVSHSLIVKASDGTRYGDRLFLSPGKSGGIAVTLAAGKYEIYCDVPGHKEAGMDATLTVG